MGNRDRIFVVAMVVLACLTIGLPSAGAYVDPGAGSFIFQAMVGGVLAAGFAIKVFWRRIVSVFPGKRPSDTTTDERPTRTTSDV
jgi:hypothetical protein